MTTDITFIASEQSILDQYGFDRTSFEANARALKAGAFPADRNRLQGKVEIPKPGDLMKWPAAGSPEAREAQRLGEEAIAKGEVAVAILNGGMATRFGGVVKGIVKVVDEHTFLDLKLRDVTATNAPVTVFLMNSFSTDMDTRAHLTARDNLGIPAERLHIVAQHVSLRLTPEGDIYRDANGRVSLYAPGHGDILDTIGSSRGLRQFISGGGKYVLVSNVDNLAATLSPIVIGMHIKSGKVLTAEVTPKYPGDQGGGPARVDGHLEIVEDFRFPAGFDRDAIPVFSCNTFVIDASAIKTDYPLHWFRADKKVDGKPVVQFERLMNEVTAFVDAAYLEVPREGPEGRFLPVKTPDDLGPVREIVKKRLSRGQ